MSIVIVTSGYLGNKVHSGPILLRKNTPIAEPIRSSLAIYLVMNRAHNSPP